MPQLCVALNTSSWERAHTLIEKLKDEADIFKVGLPLYLNGGKREVEKLVSRGVRIFLDLKLHDIPSVVTLTAESLPPVDYLTVHALGGSKMMEEVVKARPDIRLLAVTVLTSLPDTEVRSIFKSKTRNLVLQLARLAQDAGAWGIVTSGKEALSVRKYFKLLNIVVPGVRLRRSGDDHSRSVSPSDLGWLTDEDIVVVGREITESEDPVSALREIRRALM